MGESGRHAIVEIPVDLIDASPYQPRRNFDEGSLAELGQSIQERGVIQPILVCRAGARYELVAGERRLRACRALGMKTIPAIVVELPEVEKAETALIENLQRKDLNCLEEAEGYERLIREFNYTQEELARRVGRSQAAIANKLRLLRLPEKVKENISREIISERHARALLGLAREADQLKALEEIIRRQLNVRQAEELVQALLANGTGKDHPPKARPNVIRILKDLRIFKNSLYQLIRELEKCGVPVELEESDDEEVYTVHMVIKKTGVKRRSTKGRIGLRRRVIS